MNVSFRSTDWKEKILSNFAATPFEITINGTTFHCESVEGFWQGLKLTGLEREYVFLLSGLEAKKAGRGRCAKTFEIAGMEIQVGSTEHEQLIREAMKQKILQNPLAAEALRTSVGTITHDAPGSTQPVFMMEKLLMSIRKELFGH